MKMHLLLVLCAGLFVAFSGIALAETDAQVEYDKYYSKSAPERDWPYSQVRGVKGRKYTRHYLLQHYWSPDKRRVRDEYGFPRHRLRTNGAGEVTEQWTYYREGVRFTFDGLDGTLLEIEDIPTGGWDDRIYRGGRHARYYRGN